MELYVPQFQLKEILEVLAGEGVAFEVTDKTFSLVVEGKDRYEVTEVKANLLETEVPAIYDENLLRNLRAFRLPSGKKILLTDLDGNFTRLVEPPPGWGR
jgi:ribosomal protein L6P/L9E